MTFFAWDPKLLLGVDDMDAEHRGLIAAMNEIHDRNAEGASKVVVGGLVKNLVDLTRKHFAHEEARMRAAAYDGLENHLWVHKDLLAKLDQHVADFAAGPDQLSPAFFSFLRLWLTAHIMGIDRKYAPSLAGKRVA